MMMTLITCIACPNNIISYQSILQTATETDLYYVPIDANVQQYCVIKETKAYGENDWFRSIS